MQPKHHHASALLVLCLALTLCVWGQEPAALPIDTLIARLPAAMRSDPAAAEAMMAVLQEKAVREKHRHGLVQAAFFRAWRAYRQEPPAAAIARIDSALQHLPGIAADTVLVRFHILKGQCHVKQQDFKNAIAEFTLARSMARKRGDAVYETNALFSLGWAYMEGGKPVEAIAIFSEVLRLHPGTDYEPRPTLLNNIASCYNTIGQFPQAEKWAHLGIAAAKEKGRTADWANGLNILARSFYQRGRTATAIRYLEEAAAIRERSPDHSMLASDYLELAQLYARALQPQATIEWGRKAEEVAQRFNNTLKLQAAYEVLADAHEALNQPAEAARYLRLLLSGRDSMARQEYESSMAALQVEFQTQKRITENLQLRKDAAEARLLSARRQRRLWIIGGSAVLAIGLLLLRIQYTRNRIRTERALEGITRREEQLRAVMEAEERERRRLAADLHDGVGQTLAAASLHLQKAQEGKAPIQRVDELLLQAGKEVRALSHQVTPELLLKHGLTQALERGVDTLNSGGGTRFELYLHGDGPELPGARALALYRCFQEITGNILKHAEATEATVQLQREEDATELMVEDNGKGFDASVTQEGLGLTNLQNRVALFGGTLNIDSHPGRGTTVIIRIPHEEDPRSAG